MGAPDSATIDNPCSSATLQSVTDPVLVNSGEENSVEIENEKIMGNESADERICNLFNVDLDSTTVDFEAAGIEEVEEMESSTLNGDMDNDICQSSAKTYNGADPIEVNDLLKNLDIPLETPSAGMIFLSEDDVERYYKAYGKQQGFLIVRGGNGYQWKNKGVKRSATWTCDCAGLPRVRERGKSTTQQALTSAPLVKSKKCQCPAKLYAVVCSDGNWLVKHVVLEHMNHTLSPNKFGSTPDCRKLPSNDVKQKLLTDIEGGISHAQPLAFLLPKRNDMDQKPFGRVINLEAVDVSEGEKMMPSLLNKEVDEDICKTSAKACNVRDTLEVDDLLKNLNNTMLEPPRVGMGFSSDEEIEKYYKAFAKQQGFQAVRHGTGYHWKNKGVKRAATWTCDCAGLPRIQDRPQMIRYDKMQLEFDVVANLAMKSDDLCASVMQGIHELKRKVEEADGQRLSRCNTTVVSVDHIGNDNESIVTTKRKEMITKYPPRRAKICRSSEIVEMPLAEMSVQNKRARPEQTLSQVL
ncbi:hypothetical protein SOVF_169420 [Spinacia oleracea]|nr:hypothetical protein SOVF_169420 [Spinacia oleracea]